ncbi:MAG TPA: DUF2147 domain-containing protein [Tardiphaga sp.]
MTSTMRMILRCVVAVVLMAATPPAHAAGASDPSGTWMTEDGRARIRIERCGAGMEQVCGYIVWMKESVDARGEPLRDKFNPKPAQRARLVLGHQLIMGLKPSWERHFLGEIYNADDGKTYSISLWRDTADALKVRGCMFSVFCATQVWRQTNDVLPGQLVGATGDPAGPRPDKEWAQPLPGKPAVSARIAR